MGGGKRKRRGKIDEAAGPERIGAKSCPKSKHIQIVRKRRRGGPRQAKEALTGGKKNAPKKSKLQKRGRNRKTG